MVEQESMHTIKLLNRWAGQSMTKQIYNGYVQDAIKKYIKHIDLGKRRMVRATKNKTNGRLSTPEDQKREQDRLELQLKNIKRKLTRLRSVDRRDINDDKRGAE